MHIKLSAASSAKPEFPCLDGFFGLLSASLWQLSATGRGSGSSSFRNGIELAFIGFVGDRDINLAMLVEFRFLPIKFIFQEAISLERSRIEPNGCYRWTQRTQLTHICHFQQNHFQKLSWPSSNLPEIVSYDPISESLENGFDNLWKCFCWKKYIWVSKLRWVQWCNRFLPIRPGSGDMACWNINFMVYVAKSTQLGKTSRMLYRFDSPTHMIHILKLHVLGHTIVANWRQKVQRWRSYAGLKHRESGFWFRVKDTLRVITPNTDPVYTQIFDMF